MDNITDIKFQLILENKYGKFYGRESTVGLESFQKIIEMTKTFYNGGFELTCEDGTFIVFPPDVVRSSILKVKKLNKKENVQE